MAKILKKAEFPFIGGSDNSRSRTFSGSKTINMYPELDSYGAAKNLEVAGLFSRSGLRPINAAGLGPHRGNGAYTVSNSQKAYVVSGNEIYQITSPAGAPIPIVGNLSTTSGAVSMIDNGVDLLIVDGTNGYLVNLATNAFSIIVDAHFYNGARTCTYLGGYFICEVAGTSTFFFSNVDSATWPSLNISSADTSPDIVVAVWANNQQLYVGGTKSFEVWALTGGSASEPFQPITGQAVNIGISAPATLNRIAGTFLWLGNNDQGDGVIYAMANDSPERISNPAIEYQLQQLGDLSTSTSITWQEFGHQFYAINCSGSNTTIVYDFTTKQFVNFESRDEFGIQNRWFANTHCFLQGSHIMGDYRNGNMYVLDNTYYKDGTNSLPRTRRCPHSSSGVSMNFYGQFCLDVQPGAGTLTVNPRYALRISRDGGFTWGNPIYATAGKIGEYMSRVKWQRLGRGRDIVFEITCDEDVNVVMLGAYLDMKTGTN